MKAWKVIVTIACLVFVLFAVFISIGGDSSSSGSSSYVKTGEQGKLYNGNSNTVPVCKTYSSFSELVSATSEQEYSDMLRGSDCYVASTMDDYGLILITDKKVGTVEFRFINKQAVHYGKTAWTYSEFVVAK